MKDKQNNDPKDRTKIKDDKANAGYLQTTPRGGNKVKDSSKKRQTPAPLPTENLRKD